jgi:hypothetical protein
MAFIVSYLLLASGIISNWQILTGIATWLSAGIVAMILDNRTATDQLANRVETLVEANSWPLQGLVECQKDFASELRKLTGHREVVIEHLALDMSHAWRRMRDFMHDNQTLRRIDFRLLMITDDPSEFGPNAPDEVVAWTSNAKRSLARIKEFIDDLASDMSNPDESLRVTIKMYHELPFVHGFALAEPIRIRYFTLCRWKGKHGKIYDWGDDKYRKVVAKPSDRSVDDLASIFDGYFDHLWNDSRTVYELGSENSAVPTGAKQAEAGIR